MEKEENFIVMGILLGVLLIIVVVLGVFMKISTRNKDIPVNENKVVDNYDEEEEKEEPPEYNEIFFELEENHITSDFTVDVIDDAGTITHELFFSTNYKNYYFNDIGSTFTFINFNGKRYNVKDALDNGIISIYDLKDKLGDSIIEEERYKLIVGDLKNETIGTVTYDSAKELFVNFNHSDMPISSYSKGEIVNLFNYLTAEEKVKAYKINDTNSYMYETNYERIYACASGKVYITAKSIDLDCN